jgi:hypothetical protein
MWFSSDHRGVCIFVRGKIVAPRQWLIHATVASGPGIDIAASAASRQRTLSDLWQGIEAESRVGRHLGANAVRVVVDGDPDIAGLFLVTGKPEREPAPAPLREPSDVCPPNLQQQRA